VTEYSIFTSDGPFTSSADDPVNLGHQFSVASQGWVIGLRYFRGAVDVNPDELRLWQADSASAGTSLASVVPPVASTLGWQTVPLVPAVELTPGQIYKTVGHFPDHYVATPGFWTSGDGAAGITNGILTAQNNDAALGGQGTFKYGAGNQYPDGTFNGGGYWVDVLVTDVDPSGGIIVVLDLAVETDTAHAGTPAHAVPLALAAEVDSGQQLVVTKTVPLAQAVETDTGLVAAVAKVVTLGQAVEVDSAFAGAHYRSVSLAQAVETDSALPITVGGALLVPGTHTASASVAQLTAGSSVARLEAR
jgi:hypothetical protein